MVTSANPAAQSPTEAPELAPGTVVEGRYRVIRLIGVGGTGVVYEVEHTLTSQRLALKTLLDRAQAPRLEQEGRALARLRSPHVVKVVDLGTGNTEVGPFLVMTLLEGRNLRDVLEGRQKLSLAFVANVAVQVCAGLDEAHRAGLVHRDLKPDNIHLADPSGGAAKSQAPHELAHATVFDFGVVKVAATEATSQLTRTGSTVGTPYYMSLEQLRGSGTVDALSDVYAFCVVLYECLAGARPFEAGTLGDLIYAICSTTPAHLSTLRPDLPKDVVDIVMSGLSRVKEERPKSMRALALALEPYADKGFTVWLRVPDGAGATGATPGAPPAATPAPAAVAKIKSSNTDTGSIPGTATATGTVTTPQPRLPRPTERLQRPPPKKPEGPLAPPRRPAAPEPPAPVVAAQPAAALPAGGALPDPSLLARPQIVSDPTTSSLDGTTPVEELEAPARDRETPTEMFVREIHGDPEPGPPPQVPTMSLPATGPAPTFGAPFANEPSSLDSGDKTAVLDLEAVQQARMPPSAPSFGAAPPQPPMAPAPPSFGQPPPHSTSSPPNGMPAYPAPGNLGRAPMHSGFSAAELGVAPSWAKRLDDALSALGRGGNDLGVKALARFRAASQEQQIVIVVVVTATVAVLLVGFTYLVAF
ncbi:MAG: serine/threonine protein kinase [Myxococcales bacterium]|nr:serine/threonine protein kinase [Myxococcales bacterium]